MNRLILLPVIMACLIGCSSRQDQLPGIASGTIERIEDFRSHYVTARNIDIWLPEGYSDTLKYPVLYMHDGQMLYDSSMTWNRQAWDVDDVASDLFLTDSIRKFIVVGIWNGGKTRHPDYFPQKPFEQLSQAEKDTVIAQLRRAGHSGKSFQPRSDSYLKFIVEELIPFVEEKYSVQKGRDNTFIAGSSMGGLISIYALCEYPGVFGGAACLSTHWVGTFDISNNPVPEAFVSYLAMSLPDQGEGHRIYFDCGDGTLDSMYPPIQKRVDSLMRSMGYDGRNWMTRYYPGEEHSEKAWSKRLHIPLEFLFAVPQNSEDSSISTGI